MSSLPRPASGPAQVALDVVVQRLQRRDVEQAQALARALVQAVDPVEEGGERLARAGRRLDQRVLAARDRGPALLLGGRRALRTHPRTTLASPGLKTSSGPMRPAYPRGLQSRRSMEGARCSRLLPTPTTASSAATAPALADALLEVAGVGPGCASSTSAAAPGPSPPRPRGSSARRTSPRSTPRSRSPRVPRAHPGRRRPRGGGRSRCPSTRVRSTPSSSQLVVNFISDAPAGVAEMRRVAKPRRRRRRRVWDYGGEMRMLRCLLGCRGRGRSGRRGQVDESSCATATPEELEALWSEAGLEDVDVSPLDVEASYEDFDDLWTPFLAGIGPAGAHYASLDPPRQEALRERLRARSAGRLGRSRSPPAPGASRAVRRRRDHRARTRSSTPTTRRPRALSSATCSASTPSTPATAG